MSPTGLPTKSLLLALGVLGSAATAAKTVILQSPWTGAERPTNVSIYVAANGGSSLTRRIYVNQSSWSYTFSSNAPGGFYFINSASGTGYSYSMDGMGSSANPAGYFNLDAQFATKDTVWILADTNAAAPRKPTLTTTDPVAKKMVVMFRSPWTYAISFQVENLGWVQGMSAFGGTKWYAATLADYTTLSLGIRDPSMGYNFGSTGPVTSATATLSLDSLATRNDTIWVVGKASGAPVVSAAEPPGLVVLLKNPWASTNPGVQPGISLDGTSAWTTMSAATGMPGWSAATIPYTAATFSLRDSSASGFSYVSSNGINASRTQFPIDTLVVKNDTVWVVPAPSGVHSFLSSAPTTRQVTLMLRNPWDSLNPGQPPYGRVEGAQWNAFATAPGGWFSMSTSVDGARLQVAIRNATGTSYLYSYGLTTTSTSYLLLDTALARNDTIWLVPQSGNAVLALSSEPKARPGTVMLLNPWEGTASGLAPWMEVESQGQVRMAATGTPGWYSASFQVFGNLLVQFWDNAKLNTRGRYLLDTALAKNDTIWVVYPNSGSSTPRVFTSEPPTRTATVMFKSPWDTTAPFLPGSIQVEGAGWKPLSPVASMPGWYSAGVSFVASLSVGIRDSKGTSYIAYYGTTTSSTSTLVLDTAYAKNDTVWIVGGAGTSVPTGVFTSAPPARPLTVILQSPWETAAPGAAPSILINGKNWQPFAPLSALAGWYATSLDFYGSLQVQIRNAARNSYLYYGGTTSSSTNMILDTAYAKNDTIWLVPLGAGTRAFAKDPDPQTVVVMLDNPWKNEYPNNAPQLQVEGGGWVTMTPVAGDSGWYSAKGVYVADLSVALRAGPGYSYLGPQGTTSQPVSLNLDSLARRNDTIWISSGSQGKPPRIRIVDPKHAKVAMVFNPWDGVFPLQRPVAYLGGSTKGQSLSPSVEHCGWYALEMDAFPRDLLIRASRTGESFGSAGVGSSAGIDLSSQLTDTVWISPASSGVRVSHLEAQLRGTCATALIPATVRDFKLSALAPSLNGSATNLVTDRIGPDRKPSIRRGSPGLPMQQVWFRDSAAVNASTCRDLVMTLDTATGVYRMSYPNFYPVDDFTALPGGAANPYNDKNSMAYGNNYGFCLETHGQFRYRKGQVDSVGGQDDIFQYLNGKLVANLGGTHANLTRMVGLDTLGLADGNVYPWDLFFCDRMSSNSVLAWSMPGLLANPEARVDSSVAGSVLTLRASSVTTVGQGCDRTESVLPVRGWVAMKGLYDTAWTTLASGTHNGGIRVLDSSGVQVDTSALTGLPYGIYQIRLRAANDTLVFRDIVFQVAGPSNLHPYAPAARCDLRSGTIRSANGCINLSDLNGDTLRISRNTTRLSTEGLVLCGGAATVVAGTDIAYLQDNSGSMSSSDPTSQRGNIVRDAIELHSQIAPSSYAAYLPFESSFTSTQIYNITDPVERADILSSITLGSGGGTNYAGALGWARALLEGAKSSSGQTMAASPNANKAIIVISDGQPGDESASNAVLLPNAPTSYQGANWTLPADTSVPVFGFMITTSSSAMTTGKVLYDITQKTGGDFIVIPPSDPDSLRSAMMTVLGSIVARARPDTLRITNLTNGQVSRGLSSGREGAGWRFRLDSLVGLEPGVNQLQMRGVFFTDRGDSVVNAKWTVVVGDSTDEFVVGGRDTTLMLACGAPTQLKVRPAADTTRHFADSRDASLSFWLDMRYDKLLQNTVQFWTDVSRDSGRKTLALATTPDGIRAYSNISVPWTGLSVSRKDSTVQTDVGWDTLRAVYRTPRDRRDTAVGFLPVFRPWPVSVRFVPDTVKGAKGELVVVVRDPNVLVDTVRAKVFQNRRDSVWLTLRRDSTGQFLAKVPFAQGTAVVDADTLLQAGPFRIMPLDSVFALYQSNRDTAILKRPDARLRFSDADGRPLDSLAARSLAVGGKDTLRVGVFVDTLLISNSTDSVAVSVPSWLSMRTLSGGTSNGRFRLSSGKLSFSVVALGPGSAGDVVLVRSAGPDTLHRRLDVGGVRLRFVDGSGRVMDSARVDRDVRSDTLLRVEVWDGSGFCGACDGWMTDSVSTRDLRFSDSTGAVVDSVRIEQGRAVFRLVSDVPVSGASVALRSAALGARGVVAPVDFRLFSLRFVDGSGKVVDSASVDRDRMTDTLLRVEVWGRSGLCVSCAGVLGVSASAGLSISDPSGGKTDSVRIVGGRGALRIGSEKATEGGKVDLSGPLLASTARISPIAFRPFRLRFVDGSGKVVDSARVVRDQTSDTLLRVEVWGRSGLCGACAGTLLASVAGGIRVSDSTGVGTDSVRIAGGRGVFRIGSAKPVDAGKVVLSGSLVGSPAAVDPVVFRPLRLRYLRDDGSAADSLSLDTLARRFVRVVVQVWGSSGPVRWNGRLGVDSAGTSVRVSDTSRASAREFPVVDGKAAFLLRSDIPATSRPRLSIDSLGLKTGFGPVSWRILPPDSAVYLDVDGDGGLDRVRVGFAFPFHPDNVLVFRWPDSSSVLDLSKASRKVSDDSLSVEWSFDKSPAPRVTAWRAASVPATFAWNASSKADPVPALERIAPIAIRARIARGTDKDTLLVWASEPLDASGVSGGDDLVRRSHPSSLGVVSDSPTWDGARRVLRLPLDRSKIDSLVRPTDSVRFAPGGEIRDGRGSAVGDASPSVEVEGLDLGPISAVVLDADADGRADRVVLRFERAPRVVDGYRFFWPGRDGKLQRREARVRDARADSSGMVLEFGLAPWEFGATQCDSVGCRDLGSMWTARWADTLETRFDLADGVLPVILKAQLRLRRTASDPDTLRAELSEKVKIGERGDWLRFGKPSRDSAGAKIERLGQRTKGGRILELLLDSTFMGGPGDSVRLSAWPEGEIEDGAGNRPGRFLHWAPLEVGAPRSKLVAMVWPDVARYTGWSVPPAEPPLSVFVRPTSKAPWKTPSGNSPRQETSHYTGILLRTNKSLEGAALYLYDNMGVAMANIDLADIQKALREGRVDASLRGDVDLWIAWNGLTRKGTMAPSGVYLARVVGWVIVDGRREVVNQVYSLGWHNPFTPAPPPDLEFLPQYDWTGW